MAERLYLEDMAGMTEHEVKVHLAREYSDEKPGAEEKLLTALNGYDVLVAYESVGNHGCDSSSWFLLRCKAGGKLYEVSGSHCSCYGFEGQFDLDEAPVEYLKSDKFYFSTGGYDDNYEANRAKVGAYLATL